VKARTLTLALCLALPLPALSETREERLVAAGEYVDLALADFDMGVVIASLYQPILDQVTAGGAVLTETQLDQIRTLYLDAFEEPLPALMRDQAGIMADMMTLAEITALRDFYATPEGKSVMAKLPQLTAAQQPALNAFIGETMQALMPQVLAIVNGEEPPEPTSEPTAQP
jgi:hypothetical protein